MNTVTKDKGFYWVSAVLKSIANTSDKGYFFAYSRFPDINFCMAFSKIFIYVLDELFLIYSFYRLSVLGS